MKFTRITISGNSIIEPAEKLKKFDSLFMFGTDAKGTKYAFACEGLPSVREINEYITELMKENPEIGDLDFCMLSMADFINKLTKRLAMMSDNSAMPEHLKREARELSDELDKLTHDVHIGITPMEVLGDRIEELAKEGKYLIPQCQNSECKVCNYLKSRVPKEVNEMIERAKVQGLKPITSYSNGSGPNDFDQIEKQLKKDGKIFMPLTSTLEN